MFTDVMDDTVVQWAALCSSCAPVSLYNDSKDPICSAQEGDEGKEEEEKEALGKLEYSLDYNFTDNQV